jgi:hypothetical protein
MPAKANVPQPFSRPHRAIARTAARRAAAISVAHPLCSRAQGRDLDEVACGRDEPRLEIPTAGISCWFSNHFGADLDSKAYQTRAPPMARPSSLGSHDQTLEVVDCVPIAKSSGGPSTHPLPPLACAQRACREGAIAAGARLRKPWKGGLMRTSRSGGERPRGRTKPDGVSQKRWNN